MEPIYPICEEKIRPHIGKPVCAVLHDGTHIYGNVAGFEGDQLMLRFDDRVGTYGEAAGGKVSSKKKKAGSAGKSAAVKNKGKKKQGQAEIAGYYPYGPYPYYPGYGAGLFALSVGLIAALFVAPFFFI
ncbi:hypothetical protein [Marinicrinis sediminis]|uniref:Uncharacterized protein n=1 Tax=Marinicrinis sediminis TaxID=1652465 RepID=A0ABW5R6B6_9BACL